MSSRNKLALTIKLLFIDVLYPGAYLWISTADVSGLLKYYQIYLEADKNMKYQNIMPPSSN